MALNFNGVSLQWEVIKNLLLFRMIRTVPIKPKRMKSERTIGMMIL
jgi:hypothetical protein